MMKLEILEFMLTFLSYTLLILGGLNMLRKVFISLYFTSVAFHIMEYNLKLASKCLYLYYSIPKTLKTTSSEF